jgi:hypothetical protein
MNKNNPILGFAEADGRWYGFSPAHLLALQLQEKTGPSSGTDLLEFFFSNCVVRIEGIKLRLLWLALLSGKPTEVDEQGKPREYQISGMELRKYKDGEAQTRNTGKEEQPQPQPLRP